jgi:hypothetical protein
MSDTRNRTLTERVAHPNEAAIDTQPIARAPRRL